MAASPASCTVVVELVAPRAPDIATLDALARLALEARRLGFELRVLEAPRELGQLVDLAGLGGALGARPLGHAEQREQALGVEEERHLGDEAATRLDDL
jgi:hypothetical protein